MTFSNLTRTFRLFSLMILALVALGTTTACGLDEFDEEFDTEFTVPQPKEGFFGLEPFSKTKRFKLGSDPADAERAVFRKATIQIVAPDNADLSILDSLEVYVEEPDGQTLLATAEAFVPGERVRNLDIVFKDDIRGFVSSDQRVEMTWVVYPSTFAPPWPEDGLTIRTDVTIRIEVF